MRELSDAEYRGILTILAHPGATERERARAAGLPTSTYHLVHRRMIAERQIDDVVIPNPGPCGYGAIEFALARPALTERDGLTRRWSSDPECVLLWSGVHALFAVFFRARPGSPETGDRLGGAGPGLHRIRTAAGSGAVPIYFDYSGAWARFGGAPPPAPYPMALDLDGRESDSRVRTAAQELVESRSTSKGTARRRSEGFRSRRARARALDRHVVQRRTVLNLRELAPFRGRRIGEILLVYGRLRRSGGGGALLEALRAECGACPFLFAQDTDDILFGGLGQTSASSPGRVPLRSARRPVAPVLAEHLDPAEVYVEPVERVEELIRHRYALPGDGSGA